MFTKTTRRQVGGIHTHTPIYKTETKLSVWGWAAVIFAVLMVIGALSPKQAKAAPAPEVAVAAQAER